MLSVNQRSQGLIVLPELSGDLGAEGLYFLPGSFGQMHPLESVVCRTGLANDKFVRLELAQPAICGC